MKELLQKIVAEKRTTNTPISLAASSSPSIAAAPSTLEPPSSQLAPQPVTAVQVAPLTATSSAAGLVTTGKPAAIAGSKVTVGAVIPNSTSGQFPQAFSQATLESSLQLPKVLREKIAKLPKEQQRFVYMHHFRQLQQLKEQQQKQQVVTASPKVNVLEKQQQLVQEQQVPLVLGVAKPGGVAKSGGAMRGVSALVSVGSGTVDTKGKANFASMKIVPGAAPSVATPPSRRKGKGKDNGPDME